eukprot:3096954-Rhodomonas_salina.3
MCFVSKRIEEQLSQWTRRLTVRLGGSMSRSRGKRSARAGQGEGEQRKSLEFSSLSRAAQPQELQPGTQPEPAGQLTGLGLLVGRAAACQ